MDLWFLWMFGRFLLIPAIKTVLILDTDEIVSSICVARFGFQISTILFTDKIIESSRIHSLLLDKTLHITQLILLPASTSLLLTFLSSVVPPLKFMSTGCNNFLQSLDEYLITTSRTDQYPKNTH